MCGPAYRDESHKDKWLANMVRDESWAKPGCKERLTRAQDFGTFVASLYALDTQESFATKTSNSDTGTSTIPYFIIGNFLLPFIAIVPLNDINIELGDTRIDDIGTISGAAPDA